MDMQKVIAREGRDAKNLLLYHLSSDDDLNPKTAAKKPPVTRSTAIKKILHPQTLVNNANGPRVRSASTGRDKRSELQARYWALLFGNLQRAINEIYQTVECYENLSSCQETILVLENYIRDFKALAEWFRVSWDYEATPLPQRPQSLAWEVRKSNPAPRIRTRSLSSASPNISGKSSPCPSYSGKSSPCSALAVEETKGASPRKKFLEIKTIPSLSIKPSTTSSEMNKNIKSPRMNVRELFFAKPTAASEPDNQSSLSENLSMVTSSDSELTKIPEEGVQMSWNDMCEMEEADSNVQSQKEDEPKINSIDENVPQSTCEQYAQTSGFVDEFLTLQQYIDKYESKSPELNIENSVAHTVNKLNQMENEFLNANSNQPSALIDTSVLPTKVSDTVSKEIQDNVENFKNIDLLNTTEGPPKVLEIVSKPNRNNSETVDSSNLLSARKVEEKKVPPKYSNVVNRSVPAAKAVAKTSTAVKPTKTNGPPTVAVRNPLSSSSSNSSITKRVPMKPTIASASIKVRSENDKNVSAARDRNNRAISGRSNLIPTNTASRLAGRSKTMIEIGNTNKNRPANKPYKSNTLSRDSFGSSTSTLRASNDRLRSASNSQNTITGSSKENLNYTRKSEPRTMPTQEDNDGWLMVKTRRRSSLHWANRFNQPTGYASLPSLALLNQNEKDSPNNGNKSSTKKENKKATKPVTPVANRFTNIDTVKSQKASTATIQSTTVANKSTTKVQSKVQQTISVKEPAPKTKAQRTEVKPKPIVSRAAIIQRQKSDITGLKLNSLRREYLKKEKSNKLPSNNNKPESESLTKSKQQMLNMNIKVEMGLSSAMCDLYASCLENHDHGSKTPVNEERIESENDDEKVEIENEEIQRKLIEEQECLERQILELQNTEIDFDTETDDADCEVMLDLEESEDSTHATENEIVIDNDDDISLEMRYHSLLSDLSSDERLETLATLQNLVSRHPGRAQELHQKLSSPSRRRSLHETLKKYQAKQARAKDMRDLLSKEKALKIQTLLARVEDVKLAKQQLIEEKRLRMEEKQQRYAENRTQYLKDKIRKAHDEEEKLKEIAFIKNIEAQNKRLDFEELRKEQEGRLQDLEQERQKRMEEKAAKEAAVERRRQELAKERQKRLEKMDETRREREQRVEQMQEEKEKLRQKIAREKARDREERLLALHVQQQQTTEELQRKILQKQQESARRHEENIEHIRQRAQELTMPSRNVDENGVRGDSVDRTEDDLSSVVSDLSIEQTKASKKKLKKLKQRITQLTEEYMSTLEPVPAYMRRDSDVPKLLGVIRKGGGPHGFERPLGQLARLVAKPTISDFQCLWLMDGLGVLANVITSATEPSSELSRKALIIAVQTYRTSCSSCPQIARHAILGNTISTLFDALLHSLQTPDDKTPSHPIELSTELMLACTVVLSPMNTLKQPHPKVTERLPDIISYAVQIGLLEVLSRRCMKIRESIENHQGVVLSILACLGLLTKFADICPKDSNISKFLNVVKSTELFGAISLLYATVVPVGEYIPPRTISLAAASFNLILTLANLDLVTFQSILSHEALSLKFLDVVTILLKYCGPNSTEKGETQAVIVDLVATLGFFCANNKKNQDLLTVDQSSTIIKSLSKLPKAFNIVVYPTLIAIICDNDGAKNVIGRDFNLKLIEEYQNSEMAKKNKMLAMLQLKTK